ncbi:hypothetical protein CesoFtcFv8_015855 [Champsocephalus esox]|uniref:Uncharacterized protein n=1 Tax=Champsocephalus esox TaxID=159716 RepID=A0AAN8BLX2_9TELE|nr:hypothetical protein CesoFtcFv8_015855 [Champsocephalus esox]
MTTDTVCTEGHEWAAMCTAVTEETEKATRANDVASPASSSKSPPAVFNLRRPRVICGASHGTQSPNKALPLKGADD